MMPNPSSFCSAFCMAYSRFFPKTRKRRPKSEFNQSRNLLGHLFRRKSLGNPTALNTAYAVADGCPQNRPAEYLIGKVRQTFHARPADSGGDPVPERSQSRIDLCQQPG